MCSPALRPVDRCSFGLLKIWLIRTAVFRGAFGLGQTWQPVITYLMLKCGLDGEMEPGIGNLCGRRAQSMRKAQNLNVQKKRRKTVVSPKNVHRRSCH